MRRLLAALVAIMSLAALPNARAASTSCGWPIKADSDLVNVAWPDESAQYWAAPFVAAPGTTMTISGRFPLARYMSFHLYEGSMPVDAVTDYQIVPDSGTNPFVHEGRPHRGRYVHDPRSRGRPARAGVRQHPLRPWDER